MLGMKKVLFVFLAVLGLTVGFGACVFAEDLSPAADDTTDCDAAQDAAAGESSGMDDAASENVAQPVTPDVPEFVPGHKITIAPYPKDKIIRAKLVTSVGTVTCNLFAGAHQMTVMNFVALSKGKPAWTDASGAAHSEPYYRDLAFSDRVKNAYAAIGERPEGTDFVIPDERCSVHEPKAGAIAMLQPYPGMASTRFVLLARDEPNFKGMYTFFGACEPIDAIRALTKQEDAKLERIEIEE